MQYLEISRVLGKYFLYLAAILLLPLGVSILYEWFLEKDILLPVPATLAFLAVIGICLGLGFLLTFLGKKENKGSLHRKESILLVILIWVVTAAVGATPFLITKVMQSPIDAYFESMSGLTTTGATIIHPKSYDSFTGKEVPIHHPELSTSFYGTVAPLKDSETGRVLNHGIEALGKPLLFWRSFLQWFGGIGVVVLFITLLPALGMGGKFLYESEVSGPTKEGIAPRIKETAVFLCKIYLGLTLLQILLLRICDWKLPLFDAITLSFSTLSTGGFTVRNDGLAGYSLSSIWIIGVFMVLGGLNFSLYFHFLKKKIYRFWDPELKFYLLILFLGFVCIFAFLWSTPFFSAKDASFQAISAQTSTGFSLVNTDIWPLTTQLLLIVLMFIGGMSGSTSGGIKVIRILILAKVIGFKLESFFRPEVVRYLKVGNKEIADKTAMTVLTFFSILVLLLGLGVFLLVWDQHDFMTSFGIISTTLTNTGLYFGMGPIESLGFLSPFSKIICILWMLLGRLEFFSLLILLVPSFWRNR